MKNIFFYYKTIFFVNFFRYIACYKIFPLSCLILLFDSYFLLLLINKKTLYLMMLTITTKLLNWLYKL